MSEPRNASRRRTVDVVIVGAGPAGLSAALVLGRCCRSVLVCDRGTPRSWASKGTHAFVTRDGVPPETLRSLARKELSKYDNVTFWAGEIRHVARADRGFRVRVGRQVVLARKLLLATGVFDDLPAIRGCAPLFGISVFPCPYCDGWELRGKPIAVYGKGKRGFEMARALRAWSSDVVLCTDGPSQLGRRALSQLTRNGIEVIEDKIARLVSSKGRLTNVAFRNGRHLRRDGLFFDTPVRRQSPLVERLGCHVDAQGRVKRRKYADTSVRGVFVAGNIVQDVQLSIVAAAEGARAAFGINRELTREDFERRGLKSHTLRTSSGNYPQVVHCGG